MVGSAPSACLAVVASASPVPCEVFHAAHQRRMQVHDLFQHRH